MTALKWTFWAMGCGLISLVVGCSSPPYPAGAERGPNGTIAYYIEVETSEPGARIEVDGDYLGKSPLKVKIWGDRDGTFHNFGSHTWKIKAFAVRPGQYDQFKVFQTGKWFKEEDKIPHRLYFDLDHDTDDIFHSHPKRTNAAPVAAEAEKK